MLPSVLSPAQAEIIEGGMLDSGFSCVLQMPTGSGKTWLAEQAILNVLEHGFRAIYLTPLRALATELTLRWQKRFTHYQVGVFTGDYGDDKPFPVPFKKAKLLVMTPERLDACTRNWQTHWSWVPEVDLVVVDELHLLGDRHRGARLEGALLRFRRLNPFTRFLGLSATLGNRTEIADWLEGVDYVSTWRPIPLQWQIVRYRKAEEKPSLLIQVVSRNLATGGKSLIFVQSRRRAEQLSKWLQDNSFHARHHHAGLSHTTRQEVEAGFRGSEIDILVATATLEMGINLPVRQVVLYDLQYFDGYNFQPLSTNSVWQRVGRAGRPGLDTEGEAVLMAPIWDRFTESYKSGAFEPIRSAFTNPRNIAEQIVTEVACGLSKTSTQLKTTFAQSLAAHQNILPNIAVVISKMMESGMIKEYQNEDDPKQRVILKATRLGRIAVRHLLTPDTVLLFQKMITNQNSLTFFDLLLVVACSDDCEPIIPVDYEELDELAAMLRNECSSLLQQSHQEVVNLLSIHGKRLLSALKMALIIRTWTRTSDIDEIADLYDCYPFEVERLCESYERLLLAMAAIPENNEDEEELVQDIEEVKLAERVTLLHKMVASGLDETTVTLTLIDGIGPKLAKRLFESGITDIEELALAEPKDLSKIPGISLQRAKQWVKKAMELVKTHSALRYREFEAKIDLNLPGWPAEVDPYRLRRALDLKVTGSDGGCYRVIGGTEPHRVRIKSREFECDCIDFSKGYLCKHILAVCLKRGDRVLGNLKNQLASLSTDTKLDLFHLWYGTESTNKGVKSNA